MKFVCLGYIDEEQFAALPAPEGQRIMESCFAYDDELRRGGHFIGGEALDSAKNAVILRIKNGKVDVTDGPYAETKEFLGGILLLEANDLNHAIALMSQHPGVTVGPFEIRPADAHVNALIAERDAKIRAATAPADAISPTTSVDGQPPVVSRAEWQQAMETLRAKEKKATRLRDALAAERRRLPMVAVEKDYRFDGPHGKVALIDLFEGRRQLAIYHFMFAEGVGGWPDAGCPGCSLLVDNLGHPAHYNARDLSLALVSRGPLANLLTYQKRMGWKLPWYSSAGTTFNEDFGVSTPDGETHGLSIFLRDDQKIYQTYFTGKRGAEVLLSNFTLLDLTPLGRQEMWEDSPPGWPQSEPYQWWRRHDEYDTTDLVEIQS
ncbi:YCII-related domain protein [Rosistilla carotiformis]|uniref:YCII-related domain protein n=1 Tax=Rosistilla carotiformis TaxID=2528017 RepID=A0A518JTR9_9BACT|nr:DUF899 family protein [Rosistilla carotiformis]QDV68951.1 YCII-related domain protein [Rosistilla carotiformis]